MVHGAVPDPGAVPDGLFGGADGGPGTGGTKAGAEIPDPAGRAAVPCQRLVSGHPLRGVFWGPAGHLHRLGGGAGGYGGILCGSGLGVVSGAAAAPPDLARGPACLCRQRGGGAGRQRRRDECAAGRFDCPGRRRRHGGLYHDRNGLPAAARHVSVHLSGVYVRRGHAAGCGPAERNAAGRLRSGERADGPGHMNILNNQIGSIYDRQKNLYSKYPRYSQQNAENKKVCGQEKITATSGKDVLGITKGDKENSYIVHFSDSAMVSRAVARGYVTVNGADVELTEDTKRQLLKVDKEASAAREKAYQDYVMQYEMAVAKQQSEAWRKALDGVPDSLRMLLEINNTENVPEYSEKQKKQYNDAIKAYDHTGNGVSWSQFE